MTLLSGFEMAHDFGLKPKAEPLSEFGAEITSLGVYLTANKTISNLRRGIYTLESAVLSTGKILVEGDFKVRALKWGMARLVSTRERILKAVGEAGARNPKYPNQANVAT